jgi:hypothetical protein
MYLVNRILSRGALRLLVPLLLAVAWQSPAFAAKIYWVETTSGGAIYSGDINGGPADQLVTTETQHPIRIQLDDANGHMYWTDQNTDSIQRADQDGSNVTTLLSQSSELSGLALDLDAGKMYYANRSPNTVYRANLDGSGSESLFTNYSGDITSMALDTAGGKMYWVDPGIDKIQRANLDGTGVENLVSVAQDGNGIALDLAAGKMYWTVGDPVPGNSIIQRSNLDGTGIETIMSNLYHPNDIQLYGGQMYWSSYLAGTISRADLDGTNMEVLYTGLDGPKGIAISAVPIPAAVWLFGSGLAALGWMRRRQSA